VLRDNHGYRSLADMAQILGTTGHERDVFEEWRAKRWGEIEHSLERMCQHKELADFTNAYALSLVESIQNLLNANLREAAAEAAIDYMEELSTQVALRAERLGMSPETPVLQDPQSDDLVHGAGAADNSLAQAA